MRLAEIFLDCKYAWKPNEDRVILPARTEKDH